MDVKNVRSAKSTILFILHDTAITTHYYNTKLLTVVTNYVDKLDYNWLQTNVIMV